MDCPCNRCDGEQKAPRGRLFIVKGIVVAAPKPKKVQTTFEFGIKTVSSLTIRAHFHLEIRAYQAACIQARFQHDLGM